MDGPKKHSVGIFYASGRVQEIVVTLVDDKTGTTAQATLDATEALSMAASLNRAAEESSGSSTR